MSAFARPNSNFFAAAVAEGLSVPSKAIDPCYLFDDIGASLFNIISTVPEHSIARAETRIQRRHKSEQPATLTHNLAGTNAPLCDDWLTRAAQVSASRFHYQPVLLTLPNGLANYVDRPTFRRFLVDLRNILRPGDHFLFTADLVKDIDKMLAAWNDQAGIVSAFNKNLLARINRELLGRFHLACFQHVVKWNTLGRAVELELVSTDAQEIYIAELRARFHFNRGESIRTLSDYKYSELELESLAENTGFSAVKSWIDIEWSFAQLLWTI